MLPMAYRLIFAQVLRRSSIAARSPSHASHFSPFLPTSITGLPPMLMFAAMGNEFGKYSTDRAEGKPISSVGIVCLIFGCIAGTGIGYSGWWCRDKVSATSFTLVGVINKCATILLNTMIWDNHAPMGGIMSLFICLVGGSIYQQAPMRKELDNDAIDKDDASMETEKLLELETIETPSASSGVLQQRGGEKS
jgi:hypothetical protein